MRLYPDVPHRRLTRVVKDAAFLLILGLLALLGVRVHDLVDQLSVLGSGVREVGDHIPLVGGPVQDLGEEGENGVHRLANVLGVLVFVFPAAAVAWHYLPTRIAEIRRLSAASQVLDRGLDGERRRVLAMRAAFALPYAQLLRYTRDPLGDLAAGRYDALVAAVLDDVGLKPREARLLSSSRALTDAASTRSPRPS